MIGIDTNILVRYLTQDDPAQAKIVQQILDKYLNISNSVFVNNIVICELVWVLDRGYKYSKENISKAIKQILLTNEFAFEDHELLWHAFNEYNLNKVDFSDALIGEINKRHGCSKTFTFDKTATKASFFELAD